MTVREMKKVSNNPKIPYFCICIHVFVNVFSLYSFLYFLMNLLSMCNLWKNTDDSQRNRLGPSRSIIRSTDRTIMPIMPATLNISSATAMLS